MSPIARHLIIEGRVQGVFFRDSTVIEARRHNIAGWVRNRHDGSVEAWLQGPAENVEALIQWCRRGPPKADVTGLTVSDVAPDPQLGLSPQPFEKRADAAD